MITENKEELKELKKKELELIKELQRIRRELNNIQFRILDLEGD